MFESLILGITSLFQEAQTPFFEAEIELPAGISRITTEKKWNAITFFTTDQSTIPQISYQKEDGNFEVLEPVGNKKILGKEIRSPNNKNVLELLFFDEPVNSIVDRKSVV